MNVKFAHVGKGFEGSEEVVAMQADRGNGLRISCPSF